VKASLPTREKEDPMPERIARATVTRPSLRPLHDRLLVRRLAAHEDVPGGVVIPDSAKEKPPEGIVVAVGPGRITKEGKGLRLDVKQGDRVLFGKYSGSEVRLDGQEFLIMKEEDVLGVLREDGVHA
jgi:chaperonin GroES